MTEIDLGGGERLFIEEDEGWFECLATNWQVSPVLFTATPCQRDGYTRYTCNEGIPRSCIESAEFIIQKIKDPNVVWSANSRSRRPYVFASFGGGTRLNITTHGKLADALTGVSDYGGLSTLPQIGEGLIIANNEKANKAPYNMHLGAVVARHRSKAAAIISDVSEEGAVDPVNSWRITCIQKCAVFNIADGDVTGLIAAISTANGNGVADTINLAAAGTYTLTAVDNPNNGLPIVTSQIAIDGSAATIQRGGGSPELPHYPGCRLWR